MIETALLNIFEGNLDTREDIEEGLFDFTRKAFNEATEKGVGQVGYSRPDRDFAREVKYNNAVFAAFKVHREQNDLVNLLTDNEGNVKSFVDFKRDALPIIGKYNEEWLQTEYSTAITRARIATRFRQFEREKHLYPNLKWLPSVSAAPRESHVPFYNKVWAQNDPFWQGHKPGDKWGCKCGITSSDEPVSGESVSRREMPDPAPGLDNNPEKDGKLFSDTHPYVKEGYGKFKDRERVAKRAAERGTLKDWTEEVISTGMPKGRTMEVGTLDKKIKTFLKKEGIKYESGEIIISDTAIRHMTRDSKPGSPGTEDIIGIRDILKENLVFFDTGKRNLVFFHELPGGKHVKFVVQPGYRFKVSGEKITCNYVITGGIVDDTQLNQKEYEKIKT